MQEPEVTAAQLGAIACQRKKNFLTVGPTGQQSKERGREGGPMEDKMGRASGTG
uniref:Uncharacterized protein n=1 Tax=Setaria italica TaxID=4555 RepID=K3YEZ3_SETIT